MEFISLGAGVQSSTMALMAARGEISMPDYAIFADTKGEPKAVYEWLDWLEKQLPFPTIRATKGSLEENSLIVRRSKDGKFYTNGSIPAFILEIVDGVRKVGLLMRQCTSDYKIEVVHREIRKIIGMKRDAKCKVWIGISVDEIVRMKPARKRHIEHIFPLIDKNVSRSGCYAWMKANGYPQPPRSACVFCPYHSDAEWLRLKTEAPEEFQRAVDYEIRLQKAMSQVTNFRGTPFLHRSCVPLDQVDFSKKTDQLEMFINECEGMCGI